MRATSLAFAAALTFAPHVGAQTPQSLTVTQAVANVQAVYANVSTYNAEFTQNYVIAAMHTTVTSDGSVTFARPGKMNWLYRHPPGNRFVYNGTQIWVHNAAANQNYTANQPLPAVLSFLTGQGQLASSFTFEMPPALPFPGGYVLLGTPTAPMDGVSKVLFYVDGQTSQVRRVTIVDGQRNQNSFDFANVVVNTNVSAQTFTHP